LTGLTYIDIEKLSKFPAARAELLKDPDLAPLLPLEGKPDPMVSSPLVGGSRQNFDELISSLFSGAAKLLFVQGAVRTESAFVRTVLENYEELKRAARGEQVRAYFVRGLAGIKLAPAVQVTTPWGVVKAFEPKQPAIPQFGRLFTPQSTALLVSQELVPISVTRENSPAPVFPDQKKLEDILRIRTLTPLLFALTSVDEEPRAPVFIFETAIVPFITSGSSLTSFNSNRFLPELQVKKEQVKSIEDLAKTLYDKYHDSLQIASLRTVSAITQRTDKADALIDAVTAWESLVGTRHETVYRVTASLTNLLQPNPSERKVSEAVTR
jgi:hypothetical protein